MAELLIEPIEAFSDNYIWLLSRAGRAFVVDPGDADPVLARLEKDSLELLGILITHHHFDHIGGVEQLVEKPDVRCGGPTTARCPSLLMWLPKATL